MKDVVLIVDQFQRFNESQHSNLPLHADFEAQTLSFLIKPLGCEYRRIAFISQNDPEGISAYQRANFELLIINGDRPQKISEFVISLAQQLESAPPRHLVLVSADPAIKILCDWAVQREDVSLSLWTPARNVPPELCYTAYNARPLEDLLPISQTNHVDIRLDYENLYQVIKNKGLLPDTKTIIESIKMSTSDLGEIVRIIAYGDWSVLAKDANRDIQRELHLLRVDTRYQISLKGKNSADMEIAEDIHRLLERNNSPDEADVIVIGTCDRDFRPVLETAKARGKTIVVLGLADNVSRELRMVAHNVRNLDKYLLTLHLSKWVTTKIGYCLMEKGMPYVDTHYLVKGMLSDQRLRRLGIATNWEIAEQWLEQVIELKAVIKGQQTHPKDTNKQITTWWLSNESLPIDPDTLCKSGKISKGWMAQFQWSSF